MTTPVRISRRLSSVLACCLALVSSVALTLPHLAGEDAPKSPDDLVGTWTFKEDRSESSGPAPSRPNLGRTFSISREGDVLVLEWTQGAKATAYRYALDGTEETVRSGETTSCHRAQWEDGALVVNTRFQAPGHSANKPEVTVSVQRFVRTADGLLVTLAIRSPIERTTTSLYQLAPAAGEEAKATPARIGDVAWIAGTWTGTMGPVAIEERWGPPAGGAMLATGRAVEGERLLSFEFLRIVERNGGLVYVAQPGGSAPTEFVLVTLTARRVVFENAKHDFPQRIVYESAAESRMDATISDLQGGGAQRFSFQRGE